MRDIIKRTIQASLFTVIIIIILFMFGFGLNRVTGIQIFSIPKNETINYSELINIALLFVSVLLSSGIFQDDRVQNQLLKIFKDNAEIVIELDKNMMFVPEYEFRKEGTQLDIRQAEINQVGIIYHFDFLTYNRTLSEATIKEMKMYIGNQRNEKVFIAESITERYQAGYKKGDDFKQFMILKGRSVENKITFREIDKESKLLLNDYKMAMNNIKFVIEYNTNGQTKYIEKYIKLDISEESIKNMKEYSKEYLAKRIIGEDQKAFNQEALKLSRYYCIKGLNHEFKVLDNI